MGSGCVVRRRPLNRSVIGPRQAERTKWNRDVMNPIVASMPAEAWLVLLLACAVVVGVGSTVGVRYGKRIRRGRCRILARTADWKPR